MVGAGDGMEAHRRKGLQGYGSNDSDSDSNGRKKRANGVNLDQSCFI
jgi:hypothetical protein